MAKRSTGLKVVIVITVFAMLLTAVAPMLFSYGY